MASLTAGMPGALRVAAPTPELEEWAKQMKRVAIGLRPVVRIPSPPIYNYNDPPAQVWGGVSPLAAARPTVIKCPFGHDLEVVDRCSCGYAITSSARNAMTRGYLDAIRRDWAATTGVQFIVKYGPVG